MRAPRAETRAGPAPGGDRRCAPRGRDRAPSRWCARRSAGPEPVSPDPSPDLAAVERRWLALLRHAADVTWLADDAGVLQWVTPSVQRRGGWDPEELVGRPVAELVDPADREVFAELWRRVAGREVAQGRASYRVVHA